MRNYGIPIYERRVAAVKAARRLRAFYNVACLLLTIAVMVLAVVLAHGRDLDGRYANDPLHAWFDSLKSGRGLCCSFADGETIQDVDWDTQDGRYRVHLDGKWIVVPPDAVVLTANRFGPAVVWPIRYPEHGAAYDIRCFMPGAGT